MNEQVEVAQTYGLVRGTTQLVSGLYGKVKSYNPVLKNSIESVESRIPSEWLEKVTSVSEPMIEGIDSRLDHRINQIDTAIYAPVKGAVAATGEKVGQWKSIRGDLTKKTVVKIEKGLSAVREFSATKGKEMIHFDLIKYSEEVLDNANTVAKPLYEPVQKNLANAVLKVNQAMVQLQDTYTTYNTMVQETASTYNARLQETLAAKKADLTKRLHAARAAARELSSTSVTFVQHKYIAISEKFPAQYHPKALTARASPALDYAVEFILASPQLFMEVTSKADINLSNSLSANVDNLLRAVKEVMVSNKPNLSEEEK